ncbi:hypothetical protein AB3D14_000782 [Vibrio alginolyticus]|uniref:hypothetical protein n=1 Tax=Vibrio alginolyticus TaxID=663 RepID=UPI00215CC44D|nr:hypothetical protein [Vibrio alginolyticus]MCR9328429.1 hypothetical protein [Vibrio alginolyticus]MCR9356801.1 hypothetical protein [Vibrio alginolyticus]
MPQQHKHKIVDSSDELESFLQTKGLSAFNLKHAIGEAVAAYNNSTSDEPAGYRGYTITAKATLSLRQSLKPLGFKKEAPHNIELTAHNDTKFAIHICRGDEQSGISTGFPATMRPKGPRSQEYFGLVTSDIGQMDMFAEDLPDYSLNNCPYDVWFLLLNAEKTKDGLEIKAELSKPVFCSQKGFVNGFDTRFMIDMSDFNSGLLIDTDENADDGFSDDIDLDISMN